MPNEKPEHKIYSYLDNIMGQDGIKTSNKISVEIDSQTALVIIGIGMGLVVFSHSLGFGLRKLFN